MKFRDSWRKYKDWIYVFIAIIAIYTAWLLFLNPQHIPLFLIMTIIALGFVAVMTLLPKYRRRFVKAILAYNTRQKELGGWLYRYQKIALVLFFIVILLIFPLLSQYQIIPSQFMPWAVLTFFIIIVALGAIQIAGLLRAAGWWGLLLIAVITAIAILRFLIGRWLR